MLVQTLSLWHEKLYIACRIIQRYRKPYIFIHSHTYALPLYGNTLKQSELNRLEQLQYRGAKVVARAFQFTSRQKLNDDLGWESIKNELIF